MLLCSYYTLFHSSTISRSYHTSNILHSVTFYIILYIIPIIYYVPNSVILCCILFISNTQSRTAHIIDLSYNIVQLVFLLYLARLLYCVYTLLCLVHINIWSLRYYISFPFYSILLLLYCISFPYYVLFLIYIIRAPMYYISFLLYSTSFLYYVSFAYYISFYNILLL